MLKKKVMQITEEQDQTLHRLHQVTRIPMNVLLREALDDLFIKYRHLLEEQPKRKERKR
ncbi:MAG: ribbon-helix-helix domain-containing protein [candidate division NC10 bacterium]|nr:ribbon-helix-helix domain-containing protein [candidate division NC10 bacterium]